MYLHIYCISTYYIDTMCKKTILLEFICSLIFGAPGAKEKRLGITGL